SRRQNSLPGTEQHWSRLSVRSLFEWDFARTELARLKGAGQTCSQRKETSSEQRSEVSNARCTASLNLSVVRFSKIFSSSSSDSRRVRGSAFLGSSQSIRGCRLSHWA